jgi:hypothetical protein
MMTTTISKLPAIPVEFVIGHAQTKTTEGQRKPFAELVNAWAEHEGMEAEGRDALRRIAGNQLIDPNHMPKELYQLYRKGEKAEQLIALIQDINEKIVNNEENWTWAQVMRVMIDENVLQSNISINRFDVIICSMIPGKGRDTVRKNGDYSIVTDRGNSYRLWTSQSHINPTEATNRELCYQIAQHLAPVLTRTVTSAI